jgi:hypothetical protein
MLYYILIGANTNDAEVKRRGASTESKMYLITVTYTAHKHCKLQFYLCHNAVSGYHSNEFPMDNTCMNINYVIGHERGSKLCFCISCLFSEC